MRNLRLYAHELKQIAAALDKLSQAGIRTDNIIVGQHRVLVAREQPPPGSDQRDTAQWVITGIERVGAEPHLASRSYDPRDGDLRARVE